MTTPLPTLSQPSRDCPGGGALIIVAPLPVWTPGWFAYFQVPVVVFLFVCYLGKLLYDTLFYNHY